MFLQRFDEYFLLLVIKRQIDESECIHGRVSDKTVVDQHLQKLGAEIAWGGGTGVEERALGAAVELRFEVNGDALFGGQLGLHAANKSENLRGGAVTIQSPEDLFGSRRNDRGAREMLERLVESQIVEVVHSGNELDEVLGQVDPDSKARRGGRRRLVEKEIVDERVLLQAVEGL